MKKILSLGIKEWFSGITSSSHLNNGLFFKAKGINPFVNPFPDSSQVGILQTSKDPTDITGGVVVDSILAGASRVTGANAGNLYMVGNAGHLYDKSLANDSAPSELRPSTTISSPANGLEIYQSNDGDKFLYYFRTTKIGRWDFDGPTGLFVDDWDTGLASTPYHPTIFFKGDVYFGNLNAIGKIYSVLGSGASTASTSLLFPADFTTTCLSDDGNYLIAGITKNLGDNTLRADTRIIFWDTVSQNFNKEWYLPDYSINALVPFEGGHIAFCGRGIWYFGIANKPVKLFNVNTAAAVPYGYPSVADSLNDAVIWGGGDDFLSTYGKVTPDMERRYFQPFKGLTGSPTFVEATTRIDRVFVGTSTPKFYYYELSGSGSTTTTVPETIFIDLKGEHHIQKIDLMLAEPLAVGDSFTLQTQTDEDATAVDWATIAYDATMAANEPHKKRYELLKDGGVISNQLKLLFNFYAGNVKIKNLDVYGERIRGNE